MNEVHCSRRRHASLGLPFRRRFLMLHAARSRAARDPAGAASEQWTAPAAQTQPARDRVTTPLWGRCCARRGRGRACTCTCCVRVWVWVWVCTGGWADAAAAGMRLPGNDALSGSASNEGTDHAQPLDLFLLAGRAK